MDNAAQPREPQTSDGRFAALADDSRGRGHEYINSQTFDDARAHFGDSHTSNQFSGAIHGHVGDSYSYVLGLPTWSIIAAVFVGVVFALGANIVPILRPSSANSAFLVPFARNPHFISRDAITNQLKEFERTHDHARVALYGIGGVGLGFAHPSD